MYQVQVTAPRRHDIQCNLWNCTNARRPYCSVAHSELAESNEGSRNAIVVIDAVDGAEIVAISCKVLRSKFHSRHCGVPNLTVDVLRTSPWELGYSIFFRELEATEKKRSWLFICEKDPEAFQNIWQPSVFGSKTVAGDVVSRRFILKEEHESTDGSFFLTQFTTETYEKALYWMLFTPKEPGKEGSFIPVPKQLENRKRSPPQSATGPLGKKQVGPPAILRSILRSGMGGGFATGPSGKTQDA